MIGKFNRATVTGLALLAPLLVLIFQEIWGVRVPDPLPTHWTGRSTVDGTTGAHTFFVVVLIISVVLALAAIAVLWFRHSDMTGRMMVCALMFGAWLMATMFCQIILVSADVQTAKQVPLPWYLVVLTVLIPILIAAGSWLLLPARWPQEHRVVPATVQLSDTEKVTWVGHAQSGAAGWVAAAGVVVAGALSLFVIGVAVAVFVISVLMLFVSEIGVRVDDAGLHTLWGPFGWPRTVVMLEAIEQAYAEDIIPMRWGGWGYRVSSRGVGAIVRSGPGIVIERRSGPRYAVTVDNAAQGADVLNALLARARRAR